MSTGERSLLEVTPEEEQQESADYRQTISQLTGVPASQVYEFELALFNEQLSHSGIITLAMKYMLQFLDQDDPQTIANLCAFDYAKAGLLATFKSDVLSYGSATPVYQQALLQYQLAQAQEGRHRALLTGASSSVSLREFDTTVRTIFPDADCITIDPSSSDKPGNVPSNHQYLPLDACNLPFEEEFDSIHTSGLLDYFGIPVGQHHQQDSAELSAQRLAFFKSARKALVEGGQLILVERPIDFDRGPNHQPYIFELLTAGFRDITPIHPVPRFSNRRIHDRFFRQPSNPVPPELLVLDVMNIGITARK